MTPERLAELERLAKSERVERVELKECVDEIRKTQNILRHAILVALQLTNLGDRPRPENPDKISEYDYFVEELLERAKASGLNVLELEQWAWDHSNVPCHVFDERWKAKQREWGVKE